MARPCVRINELVGVGGFEASEICNFLQPGEHVKGSQLWPVSHVWPKVFSWSSYAAQEFLLRGVCEPAGLGEEMIFSCDAPTPCDQGVMFEAATDVMMAFSTEGHGVTSEAAARLNASLGEVGGQRNSDKDGHDGTDAACVGVNLEGGVAWAVPPGMCTAVVTAVHQLVTDRVASPKHVHQQLAVRHRSLVALCAFIPSFARRSPADATAAAHAGAVTATSAAHIVFIHGHSEAMLECLGDRRTDHGRTLSELAAENPQVLQRWAGTRRQGLEHVDKQFYSKTMIAMFDVLEHVAPTEPVPPFAAQALPVLVAPAAAAPPPQQPVAGATVAPLPRQPFAVPAPVLARRRGVPIVEMEARAAVKRMMPGAPQR